MMAQAWQAALATHGVTLDLLDVSEWMPEETGRKVDKAVSKQLKERAKGYDLVHALSYRVAWACAEAFYIRSPWVYTAYDVPATLHSEFIDRLNAARAGICSSRVVRKSLDSADALNLTVLTPGLPAAPEDAPKDRALARARFGIPENAFVFTMVGRLARERGMARIIESWRGVRVGEPTSYLLICGEGPDARYLHRLAPDYGPQILIEEDFAARWAAYTASSVVLVASEIQGYSWPAAEAMMMSRPVVVPNESGLEDMVLVGVNGWRHDPISDWTDTMLTIASRPEQADVYGRAALREASHRYELNASAERLTRIYREALGE